MSDKHAFFYNSENGDRVYDADSFSDWLQKFFTTGVFAGDLQVLEGDGMQVSVQSGYCNIKGKVMIWDQPTYLDINNANPTYDRIDTVVVERNDTERDFNLKVVTGQATDSPAATAPVRTYAVHQLVLAQIYVKAGATSLTQADITDKRADPSVCGFVAAAVDQIDFSQIQAQYDSYIANYKYAVNEDYQKYIGDIKTDYDDYSSRISEYETLQEKLFSTWFESMKDQMDGDTAGKLQLQIDDLKDAAASKTQSRKTVFNDDGSITESLADGRNKKTVFNDDGTITETFAKADGTVIWVNTTAFNEDGSISEDVS